MSKQSFKPGTMLNPVPAVMVSCGDGAGKDNIITIAWTGIINSEPPMTYISVRKSRYSHSIIEKSGEFAINLCSRRLLDAADWCGVRSGRDFDKFEVQRLTKVYGEQVTCPMIEESPVNLECRVTQVIALPSHDMFLAEIVGVHVAEEFITDSGKIDFAKMDLLAFSHGEYFVLSPASLGRLGFSVMKPKTKKRLARQGKK